MEAGPASDTVWGACGHQLNGSWSLVGLQRNQQQSAEARGGKDMENNRHAPGSRPVGGDGRRFSWLAHQVPP